MFVLDHGFSSGCLLFAYASEARVHKTRILKQLTRMEKLHSFVEEGPLELLSDSPRHPKPWAPE